MLPTFEYDVFLSHRGAQKDWTENLARHLRDDGFRVWFDKWELPKNPGKDWIDALRAGVQASRKVLLVWSQEFFEGDWTTFETRIIQLGDPVGRKDRVVPLLHTPCQIPDDWSFRQALDFTQAPFGTIEFEFRYQQLAHAIDPSRPYEGDFERFKALSGSKTDSASIPPVQPLRAVPGAVKLPEFWHVPHDRNLVFTGRSETLEAVRRDLPHHGRQALYGLGGIGKTQIAVEYAYRHQSDYKAVLWAFADSDQSLSTHFIEIAKVLNLPIQDYPDQAVIVDTVKRWLEQNDGWLLVFDNVDHPEMLRAFLPQRGRGHTLITSRARNFQMLSIMEPREIIELPAEAAREFLLKRTGREHASVNPAGIDSLTTELGNFPLALEQAGAFIYEHQTSFDDYLKSFRKRRLALLEQHIPVIGEYKETVATTWAINFAEVEKSPASADLLRLSAFLAPDAIPLELLERGKTELGELLSERLEGATGDPVIIDEVLKPLTSYSLIRRNTSTRSYSMHPMVQEVVRANMAPDAQRSWAERTLRVVSAGFPEPEFKGWPYYARLLSHALLAIKYVTEYVFEFREAATLLRNVGFYLQERAQYSKAEPLYRDSLAIRQKLFGLESPETADSLNKLGWLYGDRGDYAKAEKLCKESLEINEKKFGFEHRATAASLNDLAKIYTDQKKFDMALPLCERALSIREKILPRNHKDLALSLNNLATVYSHYDKAEEAESLYKRALDIREEVLGPEHPETANSLFNLAVALERRRRYDGAQTLFQQAIETLERTVGPKHPYTAIALSGLASFYSDLGKFRLAEPLLLRALTIRQTFLTPTHPYTIGSLESLVSLYRRWGRIREAHKYERKLKELQRKKRK
jgi:tetratricopeptide (TPR) repeat protein